MYRSSANQLRRPLQTALAGPWTRASALIVAGLLAACQPVADTTGSTETETGATPGAESGETAETSDEANEAPEGTGGLVAEVNQPAGELFPNSAGQVVTLTNEEACALLDEVLLSAVIVADPPDAGLQGIDALRTELMTSTDPEEVLARIANYGPHARPLSADVVTMLGSENPRINDAVFAVLVASDPEAVVVEGRRILSDPNSHLSTHFIAAAALTRVGLAGLEVLTEFALSDDVSPPVLNTIRRLGSYPGLFPTMFSTGGVCFDLLRFDACQVVAIDALLPAAAEQMPTPTYVDLSDANWTLLRAEAAMMVRADDGSAWAAASGADGVDDALRLDSLVRLRGAGLHGALGPAALAVLFDADTPNQAPALPLWTLSMVDDALLEAATAQLAAYGADSTVHGALTAAAALVTIDGPAFEGESLAGVTNGITAGLNDEDVSMRVLATALAVHYGIAGGEPDVRAAFEAETPDALWALTDSGGMTPMIAPHILVLWARTHQEGDLAVVASLEGRNDVGPEGQVAAWLGSAGQVAATQYATQGVPRSVDVALAASRVADLGPQVADWLAGPRSSQLLVMQVALATHATVDEVQVLNVLMTPDPQGFFELGPTSMRAMAAAVLMMDALPINELIAQRVSAVPTRSGFRELGILVNANRGACEGGH